MTSFRTSSTIPGDETGSGTAWWVLWMIAFMVLGGVAADTASAWRIRAQLQSTADAAQTGGINLPNAQAALDSADAMAANNTDTSPHGDLLTKAEIEQGT